MTAQGDATRRRILEDVRRYRDRYDYGPTLAELAERIGVTIPTVHKHVSLLVRWGQLKRQRWVPRSLEVAE